MSEIGKNKITKKIDEMFEKYSANGTEKWIMIAYFHQGDDDGGSKCYDYTLFNDVDDMIGDRDNKCKFLGNYKLDDKLFGTWQKPGPFHKDWDELSDMIWKSFGRDIEDDKYESTNACWYNYVFVTKDHQMFSCVESDLRDIKEDSRLADFNNYTEEKLEEGPDKQTLSYIKDHVNAIKPLLNELKSDEFKKAASDMISSLISSKRRMMELTKEQAQILSDFNKKFIESQKPLDEDLAEALEEAIQAEFDRSEN